MRPVDPDSVSACMDRDRVNLLGNENFSRQEFEKCIRMSAISLLPRSRTFQVWEYQVSHGNLLIRSPQAPASKHSPEQVTNLDLHFFGVDYFELPCLYTTQRR
jgi:hypothetical protein